MTSRVTLLLAAAILFFSPRSVAQVQDATTIDALKKFLLEQDYPEVFKDNRFHVRVENVLALDLDNDGKDELIVQVYPHFRQSASILIYRFMPPSEISRITEGLAPGRVQKVSGDYLDSHEGGEGVDFTVGQAQTDPERRRGVAKTGLEQLGGVVSYRTFTHMDGRKGGKYYVDMGNVGLPQGTSDCSSFEFCRVRQIAGGHLRGDSTKNYLAAWAGNEIYVYLIQGVSSECFLDKKIWVLNPPTDFNGFIPGQGLAYETKNGIAILSLTD